MFIIECFYFPFATYCSIVTLGNDFLYMYMHKGIKFPPLSVSTLYVIIILTWFDDVCRLAVFTDVCY